MVATGCHGPTCAGCDVDSTTGRRHPTHTMDPMPARPVREVVMELEGRHAVVTGAAGGIGAALATRFHAAGARVTLSDVDARRVAEEIGRAHV